MGAQIVDARNKYLIPGLWDTTIHLADIWNVSKIAVVIANGRYFDRAALDRLLVEAAAEWYQVAELDRQAKEKQEHAMPKTP